MTPRKLRGIDSSDPEDKESDHQECLQEIGDTNGSRYASKIVKNNKNCGSGASNEVKSKTWRVFWNLVTLQDCAWKNHCRLIMKTMLQEKETIHYSIVTRFTNLVLCLKPWKFPQRKQQWTRNGKNRRKFRCGTWRKSEARKRWSMKQGRRAQKFISPHWWTHVIWKMLNWRQSTKNAIVELYSEVILLKTIRDLTQYSLNKDHQHHKWQQQKSWISSPDCRDAQKKWLTQYLFIPRLKWRMHPKNWKFRNRNVQTFGFVLPRHKWPKSWSSMEDPVVLLERNLYGHPLTGLLWERQFEKILLQHGLGEGFQLGMLIRTPRKRIILVCVCGWQKIGWKETKHLIRCGEYSIKKVDLGEPTSFFDHVFLGCTQRQCEMSKDIVDNYRAMFESRISAEGTEKLPYSENFCISSWCYDMEGHSKKCVERYCELANKTTQQLHKVSTPCIHGLHFKEEEMKSVGELSQGFLSLRSDMQKLGTYWKTWYSMVSETCTIDYKVDQSLWQTSESIDILHFITHVNTNSIMWVILQNNAGWDCFKTPDLLEILRTQNLLLVEHHAFLEVIHLFQQVGCARSKPQFHTVQQNPKPSLWTFGLRWDKIPALDRWDLIVLVLGNTTQTHDRTVKPVGLPWQESRARPAISRNAQCFEWCWQCSLKRPIFASRIFVVCVWRQRGCDPDDCKGKKSHNETCYQIPQSCPWLVVRSNQFGPQNPNQVLTPKTNSQTC